MSKLKPMSEPRRQKQETKPRTKMAIFKQASGCASTNCVWLRWLLFLGLSVVTSSHIAASSVPNSSANNRGHWPRNNSGDLQRSSSIFGQRTGSLNKATERRQDAERAPIAWSQPDPRKSYSLPLAMSLHTRRQVIAKDEHQQQQQRGDRAKQSKVPFVSGGGGGNHSTTSSTTKPILEANRRNAGPGETVTLIRYVPLLMQLPADQLLHLASSPGQVKQPDPEPSPYLLTTPPTGQHLVGPTYAYAPPLAHGQNHNQPPLEAQLPAYEYPQDSALAPYLVGGFAGDPNAAGAPLRLAYLASSALQPASSLSPVGGRALSAYASRLIAMLRPSALLNSIGGQQQQQQQPMHNQLAQGPLILLAPAALQPVPSERPRPVPKFQKPVIQELLLDQASFRSSRLQPAWAHQQPNGLVCVHSVPAIQSANQQATQVSVNEQQHSSLDYKAVNNYDDEADDDGFSPSTTTKTPPAKSSPAKQSTKSPKIDSRKPTLVASQDKLKPNSSSLRDEQHGRRLGASEHQSIIPFTIKDKIEPPRQLLRDRQRHQQQSAYSPSSGVHFDEPVDAPEEERAGRSKPSKTSFSATVTNPPNYKPEKQTPSKASNSRESVHSAIDYKRELGAQAGSLPLLIASSNRNKPGGLHNGPSAATTLGSAIVGAATTTTEMAIAASTPVAGNNSNSSTSAAESGPAEGGGHSYSNNRLLSSMDNSLEEFAKMSEQLQTNPMDLIDLQNARSNFELPAQLESLSMLYNSEQAAPSSPLDSNEKDGQQRTQLGQLRWTTATTPAGPLAIKQRQTRKKPRS